MREAYLDMLLVAREPAQMIAKLTRYVPPMIDKWAEKRDSV
jgi:hypothetical protein